MGITDSIKEAYYSVEDKWYKLVDSVSEKVPAVGSFVDVIEEKGIPSFPVAILVVLLLIIGLFFLFSSTTTSTITLTVLDSSNNPVSDATVIVMQNGEKIKEDLADSLGKISFVLNNGTYSVKATKENYSDTTKTLNVNGNADEKMVMSLEDIKVTRAVYLKTANGDLVGGYGRVFYKCKNGKDTETKDTSYSNGSFNAELDSTCSEVEVISLENYSLISAIASFSGTGAVTVEKVEVSTGTAAVTISVAASTEAVPSGIRVKLVPVDGTVPLETLTTGTNVVMFNDVVSKVYYVLVQDLSGNFQTYNGSTLAESKEIKKGETTQFTAVLTKTPSSTLSISVKDASTELPIKSAEVKIASVLNPEDFQTKITGATGQVVFNVSQGNTFIVTVDHPEYLIGESAQVSAGVSSTVRLTKADSSNSNSILVRVIDSKKIPVDNVRVVLKTLDVTQPIVAEKMTGTNGEVEFTGLVLGKTYMAIASKDNFGSVNSESVQVNPRVQRILEIPFDIQEKTVNLEVVTPEGTPIAGASVKAINYFTSEQFGTNQNSSSEGKTLFSIRADKKVYFIVEATGYAKYYTSAEYMSNTNDKQIVMQKESAQLKAAIVGIYSETNEEVKTGGEDAATLSQGTYIVKAVVQVPKGTFSEAGLHIRTGKETQNVTNLVEEDGIFISEAKSSGRLVMGTTFSPPNGYDVDSKNLITTGNAKWVNSTWRNPQNGTYEIETKITVTETNPNAPLNIYYRGWAKGSSVLRYPSGTISGNELYAPANVRYLSSGATSFCEGSFCKTVTVQAMSGSEAGKKKYVTGTIEAKKDVEYLLTIDLVNYSNKAIPNASVTVEGISLDINSFTIGGVLQAENTASVGTIGVDSPLRIQLIFKSTNSGASSVKVGIASSTQTEFEATYNVNVKPNKKFTLEMVPKVIVPFLENTLYFEATDGNTPLSGVIVSMSYNKTALGTVTTNGEGIAQYNLASPKAGTELTIVAKKEGYDNITVVKKIDKSILTLVPPEIEETIKIGTTAAIETQIIIQNNTAKTIKLVSASVNGDVKNYVDIKFVDTINGTLIEQAKDKNYNLSMKLNSAAAKINSPKDLTGTLVINTEVSGQNQSFLNEIPIKIRLTFPGMLDKGKCIKVDPSTIDFVTNTSEMTKTLTITNSCAAEGVSVDLREIQAKLNEASKFGTVTLNGSGLSGQLSDKYTNLGDSIEKDSETEVVLKYTPITSVESGTQNLTITLMGKNLLDNNTSEKVEATAKLNVTMNNLSKCVTVEEPDDGILLDMAPWQQGYGRLMRSDYSSSLGSYQGFNSKQSPYGLSYMSGMGMGSYGSASGYGNGYMSAYGSMGYGGGYGTGSASYNQSSFNIINNCASDVEIDLDVDSRLTVAETNFTIGAGADNTVTVQPGYVLGKYTIKVSARLDGTKDAMKKIDDVKVTVRRLGDIDTECIKTNVTKINLNSFVMSPVKYSVYNYCYDTGVQLSRSNVATINCSSPSGVGIQGLPSMQTGSGSMYGQAQSGVGLGYGSDSYGSGAGACGSGQCSIIKGTNVRERKVIDSSDSSIEQVDFDVIPNPNYIPQRKLFNNQQGTSGLFQNLSDIRQWATETDARTDVYGNLNVNYTNAYGAQECMEFPITISDIWRIGESIDSALNWGDPTARPVDCQRRGALDVIAYWTSRNPTSGSTKPSTPTPPSPPSGPGAQAAIPVGGVVPDSEYTGSNGNIYIYIADPSALRIGPMPNTQSQYYPQAVNNSYDYSYFQRQAIQQNPNTNDKAVGPGDDARANCGFTDSINVITRIPQEVTGGALVKVEATSSGSMFKNSYGPNLMVQVDRSSMTANCVKLEMPIKASVTRMITMETQELTWNLRILFTKQGYQYRGIEGECMKVEQIDNLPNDCSDKLKSKLSEKGVTKADDLVNIKAAVEEVLKANPLCAPFVSVDTAKNLIGSVVAKQECAANPDDYGFKLISKTVLESYSETDMVDCTKFFCNDSMLQSFLLNKFNNIKTKVNALGTTGPATMLSELYRASGVQKIADCNDANIGFFMTKVNNGLLVQSYKIPAELIEDKAESIKGMGVSAIPDMIKILKSIPDKNSILLEFDENSSLAKQYDALNMTRVGTTPKRYLTINAYIKLLELLKKDEENNANCATPGICTIRLCGKEAVFYSNDMMSLILKGRMVKGILDKKHADMNSNDIETIYKANNNLNEIHLLAKFDSNISGVEGSLFLTNIPKLSSELSDTGLLEKAPAIKGLKVDFNGKTSTEIGKYSVELDYNLKSKGNVVIARLGEKKAISGAPKAVDNVFLKEGFNFIPSDSGNSLTRTTQGVILESFTDGSSAALYKRIPVKLNVTLYGTETELTYTVNETSLARPDALIKWYNNDTTELGNDRLSGAYYTINIKPNGQTKTINGLYYYPEGGALGVLSGVTGGTMNASAVGGLVNFNSTITIPGRNQQGTALQSQEVEASAKKITLDTVLELIRDKRACIKDSSIVWNESKLLGN
jgi:hypothetical protein